MPYARVIVDGPPAGRPVEHWTPLGLFGIVPLRADTYLYADATAPPVAAALDNCDRDAFVEAWSTAVPDAAPFLSRIRSLDDVLLHDTTAVRCHRFHHRRTALLGDAAHAMAPNLGQGANSALLDAAVLARELHRDQPVEAALAAYDGHRRPAVQRVQRMAALVARLAALRSPVATGARNQGLARLQRFADTPRSQATVLQVDPAALRSNLRALLG